MHSSGHTTIQQAISKQPVRVKCIILGSSGAGKTSFSRRYFHGVYEEERHSTICADFYSRIIRNPLLDSQNDRSHKDIAHPSCNVKSNGIRASAAVKESVPPKKKRKKKSSNSQQFKLDSSLHKPRKSDSCISQVPHVALQMWDTAGKERLLNDSAGLTSRLGDSFFRHANVALLVYDVTSSRSFLQLIKWHRELLERMNRIDNEKHVLDKTRSESRLKGFPIVVVGTKLDRLEAKQSLSGNIRTVPQRNVLGLKNGFKGMDYHYEYGYVHHSDIQHQRPSCGGDLFHDDLDSDPPAPSHGMKVRKALKYGLEGGSWTSDTSYMDYLRLAEDQCFPDRAMVKRWCLRHGLEHIEVSALGNIGIDSAVNIAVSIALKHMEENEKILNQSMPHNTVLDQQAFATSKECVPTLCEKSNKNGGDQCTFCNCLLQIFERLRF